MKPNDKLLVLGCFLVVIAIACALFPLLAPENQDHSQPAGWWLSSRDARNWAHEHRPGFMRPATMGTWVTGHCAVCDWGVRCWDILGPKARIITNDNGTFQIAIMTHETTNWTVVNTSIPTPEVAQFIINESLARKRIEYDASTNVLAKLIDLQQRLK